MNLKKELSKYQYPVNQGTGKFFYEIGLTKRSNEAILTPGGIMRLKLWGQVSYFFRTKQRVKGTEKWQINYLTLFSLGNEFIIKNKTTGKRIRTFKNIPGLLVQGCSFKNLHPRSKMSDKSKKLLKMYGAVVE